MTMANLKGCESMKRRFIHKTFKKFFWLLFSWLMLSSHTHARVRVLSFDLDDSLLWEGVRNELQDVFKPRFVGEHLYTYPAPGYTLDEALRLHNEAVIKWNRTLLDKLKADNSSYSKTYVACGSLRQSALLELINQWYSYTDHSAINYHFKGFGIVALKAVADYLGAELLLNSVNDEVDSGLIADTRLPLNVEDQNLNINPSSFYKNFTTETVLASTNSPTKKKEFEYMLDDPWLSEGVAQFPERWVANEINKASIVYFQIHDVAARHPGEDILFELRDDRPAIIQNTADSLTKIADGLPGSGEFFSIRYAEGRDYPRNRIEDKFEWVNTSKSANPHRLKAAQSFDTVYGLRQTPLLKFDKRTLETLKKSDFLEQSVTVSFNRSFGSISRASSGLEHLICQFIGWHDINQLPEQTGYSQEALRIIRNSSNYFPLRHISENFKKLPSLPMNRYLTLKGNQRFDIRSDQVETECDKVLQRYTDRDNGIAYLTNFSLIWDRFLDFSAIPIYIRELELCVGLQPFKTRELVYRGASHTADELFMMFRKNVFYIPSFISTTLNPQKAYIEKPKAKQAWIQNVMFEFDSKEYSERNAVIQKNQEKFDEEEVLFAPYNMFRWMGIRLDPNIIPGINVAVISLKALDPDDQRNQVTTDKISIVEEKEFRARGMSPEELYNKFMQLVERYHQEVEDYNASHPTDKKPLLELNVQ